MRTPEEIRRLARDFWVDEAFTGEDALRVYNHQIIAGVHKLCQAWDLDNVEDWLAVYRYAESRCSEEPLRTQYEHGLMLITLSVAGTHSAMGSFDTMYELLSQILELLSSQEVRRARLGLQRLGNSEIKYHIYGELAAAKWRGPESDRDRLLSVEEVAKSFIAVADHVLSYIAAHPDYDDGRMVEALEMLGLDVAAMIFCWQHKRHSEQVQQIVDWFNASLGESLSAEPNHLLEHEPVSNTWHYWTFELIKLYFCGTLTRDLLEKCHAKRLDVVLNSLSLPRHIDGLLGAWESSNAMMLKSIGAAEGSQSR